MQLKEYLAPYGLQEVELQYEGHKLEAAGSFYYVPLTEYKRLNPITPSPLSIDTLGQNINLHKENRFEDALKRERSEVTEGKRMEEALSESEGNWTRGQPQLQRRRLAVTVLVSSEIYYKILMKMSGPTRGRHLWDPLERFWSFS